MASWLPPGKIAALCFSIDDVHPSTSDDLYEAGGDLERGRLRFVEELLDSHPQLKATLFVTPDWRPVQLVRRRKLAAVPYLRHLLYHVDLQEPGRFRIDKFPSFVAYLNSLERVDVALHGLHHVHRGERLAVEYQHQSTAQCRRNLSRGKEIFERSGLDHVAGFAPPGWNLPSALIDALADLDFNFVSSARDIETPIRLNAKNRMSGLRGASIVKPDVVADGKLVHIPVNFQATSHAERADEIVACGGLVSIKAHIFKEGGGFRMKDGLDRAYARFLDGLFARLESIYGDRLWWTCMSEVAERVIASSKQPGETVDELELSA